MEDHPELETGEILFTHVAKEKFPELLLETKRLGSIFKHGKLPVFISMEEYHNKCKADN